ncbi:unnamed protein product, partial [marine sediment metagenome]
TGTTVPVNSASQMILFNTGTATDLFFGLSAVDALIPLPKAAKSVGGSFDFIASLLVYTNGLTNIYIKAQTGVGVGELTVMRRL